MGVARIRRTNDASSNAGSGWPDSKWLFGYPGFLRPINTFFMGLALLTWFVLQPRLSQVTELRFGWIALMYLRNMALMWLVFGGHHLVFYMLKIHGNRRKYHPQWLSPDNKKHLFGNQTRDNVFRTCVWGCAIWTAYEVLYIWAAANRWVPYLDPAEHPVRCSMER